MPRRHSLERRLFGRLLAIALLPAFVLLGLGTWVWAGSLGWVGTLGPWDRVAESGRALVDAASPAAADDRALAAALERHREDLSASLVQARRWAFLGERAAAALPLVSLVLGLVLAALAAATSRRLARELARPIHELVRWTELIAREAPLPPEKEDDAAEVEEVRALRVALRGASRDLAAARRRALEAERIRVWGDMARWVAHEMKNPLTPLRLAARRLLGVASRDATLLEPARVIQEETGRLEALAQEFSALGRPPEGPTSEVDLRELLAGLLDTDVPPGIEASLAAEAGIPMVEGHYEALLRAFRNLIRNAVEAMGGRGRLDVALRLARGRVHASANGATAPPSAERSRAGEDADAAPVVEVVIGDSGPGIPRHLIDRIFEPDFSTKTRGSGLGLAIVRRAITEHGGAVGARNREAGGAEFNVLLPAIPATAGVSPR